MVGAKCFSFSYPNYKAPLEKIISTDNLSYIPNLYFRKYKLIEALNYERFDFPEQKILLPRPKTSWDAVLCQVKEKAELRKEVSFTKFRFKNTKSLKTFTQPKPPRTNS
jgi:hypothetical protein